MHNSANQTPVLDDVEFVTLVYARGLSRARECCMTLENASINAVIGEAPAVGPPEKVETPVLVAATDFELASELLSAQVAAQGDDFDDEELDDDPFDDDDADRLAPYDMDDDFDDDEPDDDEEDDFDV